MGSGVAVSLQNTEQRSGFLENREEQRNRPACTGAQNMRNLKINLGPPPSRYFFDLPSLNLDHLGENKTAMGPPLWTYPKIKIFFWKIY
jgi:hypothetical protein